MEPQGSLSKALLEVQGLGFRGLGFRGSGFRTSASLEVLLVDLGCTFGALKSIYE